MGHQHDQEGPEQRDPRHARLLHEPVLPDEGGEVERRHEQHRPPEPTQLRQQEHGRVQQHEADVAETRRVQRVKPSRRERRRGAALDRPGDPLGPHPVGELVQDDPEDDGAGENRRQPLPEVDERDQAEHDGDIEERASVVGVAKQLEHDVDRDRADHDPRDAAGTAEDHHRVDGDQQRQVEVRREDAELDRGEDRARETRRRRSNMNASSLRRFTGMLISSAASESSPKRPPGAASPRLVDEAERDDDEREHAERQPEVAADGVELVAEDADRVDVRDPVRAAREVRRPVVPRQRDPVGIVRQHDVDLRPEERHDREVVAEEATRGEPSSSPRSADLTITIATASNAGRCRSNCGDESIA